MKVLSSSMIILLVICFSSCGLIDANKESRTMLYEGYLMEDESNTALEGVTIHLAETGNKTNEPYFLQRHFVDSIKTDKNGRFEFLLKEDKYNGNFYDLAIYTYGVSSQPDIQTYGILNVNGKEYNYSSTGGYINIYPDKDNKIFLRPTAYFKYHIKSDNPATDSIQFYLFYQGFVGLKRTTLDTIVVDYRGTNECRGVGYSVWESGSQHFYHNDFCCPDGDTCLVEMFY